MPSLASRDKQLLLEVARRALIAAVERRDPFENLPDEASLRQPAGAFVTLRCRGRLRGCIGQLAPGQGQGLVHVVAYAARSAALEDPRFDPVGSHELVEIEIELSVLSQAEAIAPSQIEAGKHGLIVERGWQRGLLLPQVAIECRWGAQRFLEETCVKAGLERDAWQHSATRILAFTADVFSESDFRLEIRPKPGYSIST